MGLGLSSCWVTFSASECEKDCWASDMTKAIFVVGGKNERNQRCNWECHKGGEGSNL